MQQRTKDATPNIPNELLKYAREHEGLSPNELAAKLTDRARELLLEIPPKSREGYEGWIDERTVRRWESGESRRPDAAHKKVLESYFERSIESLGFTKKGRPSFWNLPQKKNELFTGRKNILAQLASVPFSRNEHNRTKQESESPLKQHPQVLIGLAGVGKTQIAVNYAHRFCHEYHTVILLNADLVLRPDKVAFARAVAEALGLSVQNMDDPKALVAEAQGRFSSETLTRWLLIFDNVESPQAVQAIMEDFLPQDYYGHVLLTSRMDDPGTERYDLQLIPVADMPDEDGATLLLRRSGFIKSQAPITDASEADCQQAKKLSSTLGGLPLALDQAGAYIRSNHKALRDYGKLYEMRRTELLRLRGEYGFDHPDSVVTTWSLNFEQVGREARELLRFFAFLAPDAIPEELITTGASKLGPILEPVAGDECRLDSAVKTLLKYSLVTRLAHEKVLAIHRLVQAVIQDEMEEEEQKIWVERVVLAIHHIFPNILGRNYHTVSLQETALQRCQRYQPLALDCVRQFIMQPDISCFLEGLQLIEKLAVFLKYRGKYALAEIFFRLVVEAMEEAWPESLEVASRLIPVAITCWKQGKEAEAEQLLQRAYATLLTVQGLWDEEARWTIACLQVLVSLYFTQGRYAQAEPLLQQALEVRQKIGDVESSQYLSLLAQLAHIYQGQGKYKEAEELFRVVITKGEKVLKPDDVNLAHWYVSLALLYLDRGENYYTEAETLLQRALALALQSPRQHRLAVIIYENLGDLYLKQERFTAVEEMFRQALSIEQRIFGETHPFVTKRLWGLAELYLEKDKFDKALPLFDKLLVTICEEDGRPLQDIASILHRLGQCHHLLALYGPDINPTDMLEYFEEARELYNSALEVLEELGEQDHPLEAVIQDDLKMLHEDRSSYFEEL